MRRKKPAQADNIDHKIKWATKFERAGNLAVSGPPSGAL
jgi:hypothetical protein